MPFIIIGPSFPNMIEKVVRERILEGYKVINSGVTKEGHWVHLYNVDKVE